MDSGALREGELNGKQAEDNLRFKPNPKALKKITTKEKEESSDEKEGQLSDESEIEDDLPGGGDGAIDANKLDMGSDSSEEEKAEKKKPEVYKAPMMNPVFLNDKQSKRQEQLDKFKKKKASRSEYVDELRKEMYDLPEERSGFIDTGSRKAFMRE